MRRDWDAVLVQDLGVFSYIREHFPDLPLHISTQMTVTGKYSAAELKRMGAVRGGTVMELSLKEIREIRETTGLEVENFVHGALCYCYLGQCLFSSLIGGRSGNRGRCAQTCRLPFDVEKGDKVLGGKNEKYVLSLKDLCTLDLLPEILEAGVCSLKIEGRMKSPRYTAGVVSIYRNMWICTWHMAGPATGWIRRTGERFWSCLTEAASQRAIIRSTMAGIWWS